MDVDDHIREFNAAVLSHDWSAFVDRFADDAVVEFVGVPAGPYVGRDAIAAAYQQNPPDDTIERAGAPRVQAEELVVPYRWVTSGATGTMRFSERGQKIGRLVITFDTT
jgi:steroid Delta-isomerase